MDEVLTEVKRIELEHVHNDVFSAYPSPKIYQRRAAGGIDDEQNIVGTVKNMELEIDNITEFDDGYGTYNSGKGLPDLINEGSGGQSGFYYDYMGEFEQARSFLDNTEEEIERTNSVENALANGLKKRGYDIS